LPHPSEERINIPGDSKHYWRFRMHINIEELLENDVFNNELSSYIKMSGRG
jgi:4-alpha-glucanotransferase